MERSYIFKFSDLRCRDTNLFRFLTCNVITSALNLNVDGLNRASSPLITKTTQIHVDMTQYRKH